MLNAGWCNLIDKDASKYELGAVLLQEKEVREDDRGVIMEVQREWQRSGTGMNR